MSEQIEYCEREISAEFQFGCDENVKIFVKRDIEKDCLANVVEEASRLFLAVLQKMEVPADPRSEDVTDIHLTLRYWHMENDADMIMTDIQISACEIPKPGEASKSVQSLANKVVTAFVAALFNQKIVLQ